MAKYIDADRLKELLDAKYKEFTEKAKKDCPLQYQYMADGLDIAEQFIDSLQQEQPKPVKGKFTFPKFLYARTLNNKTIDISYGPQDMTAVEYIRNDAIEQEQPEVDLEKEMDRFFEEMPVLEYENIFEETYQMIARHFYKLGLNARKEE